MVRLKKSGSAKPLRSKPIEWNTALKPLFAKYKGRKHPLEYHNPFQLIVMIVLSARASDAMVNKLAPEFFRRYPTERHLSAAAPQDLYPLLRVPGFKKKAEWIISIAQTLSALPEFPVTMKNLTALKGFGRKSANVFMSQTGLPAEGVIVDLHTVRVAPRLGIADGTAPDKIEKQLMEAVEQKYWHALGMSLTYLGRETCRPTDPKCHECLMHSVCRYYKSGK